MVYLYARATIVFKTLPKIFEEPEPSHQSPFRASRPPRGPRLYHRVLNDSYWPWLAVDCYPTVRKGPHCTRNRSKLRNNTAKPQLFPATAPSASVCFNILVECIKIQRRNGYLLVITDRVSKTTETVPMKALSAVEVASDFMKAWAFNSRPPEELIANNDGCFTSKFFIDVCKIISIKNNFTTRYHPKAAAK